MSVIPRNLADEMLRRCHDAFDLPCAEWEGGAPCTGKCSAEKANVPMTITYIRRHSVTREHCSSCDEQFLPRQIKEDKCPSCGDTGCMSLGIVVSYLGQHFFVSFP